MPFERIISVQPRPPDARRYLVRELAWLINSGGPLARLDEDDMTREEEPASTSAAQPNTARADEAPEKPATIPVVSVACGASAVRRGIWKTSRGSVFYFVGCSQEESMGEPVLEAQLMAQSAVAIYLEPAEGELPFSKIVVSVSRGANPQQWCETLQEKLARDILLE